MGGASARGGPLRYRIQPLPIFRKIVCKPMRHNMFVKYCKHDGYVRLDLLPLLVYLLR